MKIDLCDEATEFGSVVKAALESIGGSGLAEQLEQDTSRRESTVGATLADLGAWDLDMSVPEELEAGAALCRSVGYWAVPYPAAERLSHPRDLDVAGLSVTPATNPAAPLRGLDLQWATVDLRGNRSLARPITNRPPRFGLSTMVDLELTPIDNKGLGNVALALALPCWTLLGMIDHAIDLTRDYVLVREQFGQALSRFQNVQFQLTETVVERNGLEELAKFAIWSIQDGHDDAISDALAFRLAAVEAAEIVFKICHQLHGTIGFCDETTLSWVSRQSQQLRRLPFSGGATQIELVNHIGTHGLAGLFDEPGR